MDLQDILGYGVILFFAVIAPLLKKRVQPEAEMDETEEAEHAEPASWKEILEREILSQPQGTTVVMHPPKVPHRATPPKLPKRAATLTAAEVRAESRERIQANLRALAQEEEQEQSAQSRLFDSPDSLKRAIIASEVLGRKF